LNDPYPLPPQNLEAEQNVLGSMLLDNATILDIADILQPEDFYRDNHQIIYRSILTVYREKSAVDALMLDEELERRGELQKIGGREAIGGIIDATPSSVNATFHARIVQQRSLARAVMESAKETCREVESNNYTADELVERSERRILAIGQRRSRQEPRSIAEVTADAMTRIRAKKAGQIAGGLMTGFVDLDYLVGGFRPGQVIVLAARPSMGKTALALKIAENITDRSKSGVLFMSIEMSESELGERYLSLRSSVPMRKIQQPSFASEVDLEKLQAAIATDGTPLFIDESPSVTPTQISTIARRLKSKQNIGLICVDYLQLISSENDKAARHEQVAMISRKLKALAKDLGVPVLAMAQLNREAENREDHRPKLSDLRESGQIEQDADVVLLLHRPECYDENDRAGATARIELVFEKELMRFSNSVPKLDPPSPNSNSTSPY
jgi:replicative DNA helicase